VHRGDRRFDRFIDLASRDTYDAYVFDMAPTGLTVVHARG
jgi:anion-transporting  ArsA/GET3 family ATPase